MFYEVSNTCFLIVFLTSRYNSSYLKNSFNSVYKPFSTMFLQKLEGKTQPCLYHVLKTLVKINFFCISFLNTINEFDKYIISHCTDFKLTY